MTLYKLLKDPEDKNTVNRVRKSLGGNAYLDINFNPESGNYQEYLEWLKIDGNVPEEAD
tara:strand:- start:6 stop:182 length:177 start_codon:yes stop_codon:yes gene_type:complete